MFFVATAAARADEIDPAIIAEKLPICIACHTETGNSIIPQNPKLAGLGREYLEHQLKDFKRGARKSELMTPIANLLSGKEIDALAAYFSRQKAAKADAVDAKLAAAGKPIFDDGIADAGVPACAGCHDEDGRGNEKFPRLAGQHPIYAVDQLLKFKSGERTNDLKSVMRVVAKRMNEEQIRAVAEYMATLSGGDQ